MDMASRHSEWLGIRFHFIIGALNPNKATLKKQAARIPNVILHHNVQSMSALMRECDMTIAAAGSTLYELCACGVATVTCVLADNQIPGAQVFASRGLMLNAGDCRTEGFVP